MKRSRQYGYWVWIISVVLLIAGFATVPRVSEAGRPPSSEEVVQRAWRRAQESGAYRFGTEIVQTTYPAPALVNVGRSSHQDTIHIEGETSLPERTMRMSLWQGGGSLLNPQDGVEIRIEGDRAYGRTIGAEWTEMDDFSGAFAPGSDLMAYLAGAKNVRDLGTETRALDIPNAEFAVQFTRYGFELDGPAFATYLRDQLERHLIESGELPAGLTLDTSRQYADMTGEGEVWVDANGLPLRLSVHVEYPEQDNGERVKADIQTDFSDFAPLDVAGNQALPPSLVSSLSLPRTPREWNRLGIQSSLVVAFFGLVLFLVTHSNSKKVYAALVLAIIASMVITPLLQSHHIHAFSQRQQAQREEREQEQQASRAEQDQREELLTSDWNPHRDPLAGSSQSVAISHPSITNQQTSNSPEDDGTDSDEDGLTDYQEIYVYGTDPADKHSDADTLEDGWEALRLGTDPTDPDSDGDQLRDDVEVQGFRLAGEMWYSDPLNPDTNNDGILDTHECWDAFPDSEPPYADPCYRDADGDLTPDLFDRDDDGDGVDDRVDLSPASQMGSFDRDTPLLLQVNKLSKDEQGNPLPVFVDFQLRPEDSKHLSYALNVLDWPTKDTDGQVQRVLDTTFADTMTAEQVTADPSSENGDMRLLPMLEITIPYQDGHYRNLPVKSGATSPITKTTPLDQWLDTSKLDPYGISVRYADDDGTLAIYVPLNLVSDETGGSQVAFAARMLYWPQRPRDWGQDHEVRVVWLVQMLTDTCTDVPDAPEGFPAAAWAQTFCINPDYREERMQIVHAYPEEWTLTGLAVREDHGMEVAIAFEDPAHDTDVDQDDHLYTLVNGLDQVFMTARDADGDGQRDLTIGEIKRRFDITSTAAISPTRWNIPQNALRVETFAFDHQDYIAHIPMTYTKETLNEHFLDAGQPLASAPTLLFAREEHFRSANLDMGAVIEQNDNQLTVRVKKSECPLHTLAAMNWRPYKYEDGSWTPYPLDQYWDQLGIRLRETFAVDPDNPDGEALAGGQIIVAQSYYLGLVEGNVRVVQSGDEVAQREDAASSDADLAAGTVSVVGKTIKTIVGLVVENIIVAIEGTSRPQDFLIELFWTAETKGGLTGWGQMSRLSKVKTACAVVGAVLSVGFFIAASISKSPVVTHIQNGLGVALATLNLVVDMVKAVTKIKEAVSGVTGVVSKLSAVVSKIGALSKEISNASVKAGIVGLVIAVAVTFGAFIVQMALSNPSGLEVKAALAGAIANTVVAVIMFAISMIPIVGWIIAAVVALIDAAIALICGLVGEGLSESKVGKWFCKGVSGLVAEGIQWAIYGAHVMVDLEDEDRLQMTAPTPTLSHPENGYSDGNRMNYALTLTNTIDYISATDANLDWKALAYWWQYSNNRLKSSTFEYGLYSAETDIHEDLSRGTMSGEWTSVNGDGKRPYYIVVDASTGGGIELTAGINQTSTLYLAEGYAVPVQECWTLPMAPWVPPTPFITLIPVCYVVTKEATTNINLGQNIKWDVFPATLDGFYDLAKKGDGYGLAWGQHDDLTFPRLKDADGDGLRNKQDGGSDPNDKKWDTDNDGLSDFFETQTGSDPEAYDSDGDGLSDREEVILGTNPNRADSDGDGLTDQQEVDGWEYAYGFDNDGTLLLTWVTADPLTIDGDGDGLTDFREKVFGFHPQVVSDPHVLGFKSQVSEVAASDVLTPTDGFVRPGDDLYYTATVENKMLVRYAQGLLSTDFPAAVIEGAIAPETFVLHPQEEVAMAGSVHVRDDADSGVVGLTQVAGAEITDPREASDYAELLLHLDDPVTSTNFVDSSGSYPPRLATCTEPHCPDRQAEGIFGSAVAFDGDDEITAQLDVSDAAYGLSLWFKTSASNGLIFETSKSVMRVRLQSGRVCATVHVYAGWLGMLPSDICSSGGYADGEWHHLAHTLDGEIGNQHHLYLDGEWIGSSIASSALPLGFQQTAISIGSSLAGSIDEFVLYNHTLSEQDVQALYDRPIFRMRFDEPSGSSSFLDSSGFGNDGSCYDIALYNDCPTAGLTGISRNAVRFLGDDYVSVGPSDSLDLGEGRFTLAAWILPQDRGDSKYDDHRQGIMGTRSNTSLAYPSLQRVGTNLIAGFGTGSQWVRHTFTDVLTIGAWNHVVVTYGDVENGTKGQLTLYINGQYQDDHVFGTFYTPDPLHNAFAIGRSSHCAQVEYEGLYCLDEDQDDWGNSNEFHVYFYNQYGTLIFSDHHGDVDQDEFHPDTLTQPGTYCESGHLDLWEDDDGEGSADDYMGSYQFDFTQPSWDNIGTTRERAENWPAQYDAYGAEVALRTNHDNPSIPFRGKIDEVSIYKRPLSADEVEDLYQATTIALHLDFDDPPGTYLFEDATGQAPGSCPSDLENCPTTGVAGRVNQAALFDGVNDSVATELNIDQQSSATGATMMAWVYPSSTSSGRHTLISSNNGGYDWSIVREGGTWSVLTGQDRESTGASVDPDQWQHVAAVFTPGQGVAFYKNGALVTGALPIGHDQSVSDIVIGDNPAQPGQYFDGRVDEVIVYRRPLSASEIEEIYQSAPQFLLHLDDPAGTTSFADDSGNGYSATCSVIGPCAEVTFDSLYCYNQNDGWFDNFGEFYINVVRGPNDKERVWWGNHIVAGSTVSIGETATACAGDEIEVYEDDNIGDDFLGSYPINLTAGSYDHQFTSGGDSVLISWHVGADQFPLNFCPTAAITGQIGLAVEFDGVNDAIETDFNLDQSSTSPGVTMMGWVYPNSTSGGEHQLISSNNGGWDWSLLRRGGTWQIYTGEGRRNTQATVQPGYWQHLSAVFDPAQGQVAFYQNGSLVTGTLPIDYSTSDSNVAIGYDPDDEDQFFDGRVDELAIYNRTLSAREIRDIFLYQGSWVEERQTHDITVDADDPVSILRSDGLYRANQDVILDIGTEDPTSKVTLAEWRVRYDFSSTWEPWTAAPACRDADEGTAWCPTFDPTQLGGEGLYYLRTRATDVVGHQEGPTRTYTIVVDGTPPTVSASLADGTILRPQPHPTTPNAWVLHLDGTIIDPLIATAAGSQDGSGLVTDTVQVTLLDANGRPAGAGVQVATVDLDADTWAVDYSFSEANPTGAYTLRVEATDQVGNESVADLLTLHLDTTIPAVRLGGVDAASGVVTGTVSETPSVPDAVLQMHLEETAGATSFTDSSAHANHGSCTGGTCPTADVTGQYGQALQFDGVDDYVSIPNSAVINQLENDLTVMAWIRPDDLSGIQRIAASARASSADGFGFGTNETSLRFHAFGVYQYDTTTVTLSSGVWQHVAAVMHADNSVTFYVDGVPKETVSGSAPINPDVDDDFLIGMTTVSGSATPTQHFGGAIDEVHVFDRALTSGEIGGLAQQRIGGVAQLDIAFAPIDPGSPFYNESLPASTVLYLPLDESGGNPDGSETTQFADISGSRLQATCDGASCPATGTAGRAGQALRFDGQDDFLAIPDDPALNLATDFTLSAWFKWDADRAGSHYGFPYWPHDYVIYDSGTQAGHWYVSINDQGYLAFGESGVMHYPAEPIRGTPVWHHVAVVKDGDGTDNLTVYLDGELVITRSVGTVTTPSGEKRIGSSAGGYGSFEGLLDEVALYDQPFSADEIRALYLGSRPLLHLPFDETWAAGSSILLDQSSWDNDATLHGPATQHIVAGNVGAGALQFNGVDDYVTVENSVDLGRGDYTLVAWFKTDASVRGGILAATNPADGNRGLLIEAREDGTLRYLHRAPTGTGGGTVIWPSATYNDGEWHHAAAVKEGLQLTLYADGVVIGQANDSGSFTHALDVTLGRLGRETDSAYFDGALDDVRIYARALPALEVQALYDSRWRPVSLPESGADVVRTSWTYTIPGGLEGSYRVDLRGWDTVGNHSRGDSDSRGLWRGTLDTLAPRVELRQRNREYGSTSLVRYDFSAQDFNLSEDALQDPCLDKARRLEREYFGAPWYAALVGQSTQDSTRLYELDGQCRFVGVGRLSAHTVITFAYDVYVSGDYAYMVGEATTGKMWVVDISDPKHPTRVGTDTPIQHGTVGIHVSGDYAYVIEDETGTMGVVDVSDPGNPQEVGFTTLPDGMSDGIYVVGKNAYVANAYAGLRVIDVSAPVSPTEIGFYDTPGYAVDVHVVGDTAYVADGDGGLRVVDVSTPALPQETGHLTMTWAEGVYVTGTYAYVASAWDGLWVVDVSSPTVPAAVGHYDTPDYASDVYVAGDPSAGSGQAYAYVADGSSGLRVVDVSDPGNPREVGFYDTPSYALAVHAVGNKVYVADGEGGLQIIVNRLRPAELTACDVLGNCASIAATVQGAQLAAHAPTAVTELLEGVVILEPMDQTVLTVTASISVAGGAYAVSSWQNLTVTVDGAPVYTETWASGIISDDLWATSWTPAGEGPHVIQAMLSDWGGSTYSDTITVTLDTQPPTITIATDVLTGVHATAVQLTLGGTVSDAIELDQVSVRVDGGDWQLAAHDQAEATWSASWYLGSAPNPDGETYDVTARATDRGGWTTLVTETIFADAVAPAPVTITVVYTDSGAVSHVITRPGQTISDLASPLVLTWTDSSDGSGLDEYVVGWTAVDSGGVTETLTAYSPTAERRHTHVPDEAQKLSAGVLSQDVYGNQTWQEVGPVYVDGPLTPDYIALNDADGVYRGWMESGCSLVGVDRRVSQSASADATLGAEQWLYVTWDDADGGPSGALRLAWTGADWSDGDLFVYLDTQPGGGVAAYDPYSPTLTGTVVYLPGTTPTTTLPGAMEADYAVWVQDAISATLLRWDGGDWVISNTLPAGQYRFASAINDPSAGSGQAGQTDLYLPFDEIGITHPATATLDLVAFASEDDLTGSGLRLWAVAPSANPVNSERVVGHAVSADASFALSHRYHWDNLDAGQCPNADYPDADLQTGLSLDPAGTAYGFFGDDLFAWWSILFDDKPADASLLIPHLDADHPPLSDLQAVTYTIHYQNLGHDTATGVTARIKSAYALTLPDGTSLEPGEHAYEQTVLIGDVGSGEAGTVTFRGLVDLDWSQPAYADCVAAMPDAPEACDIYLRWASVEVRVYDDAHDESGPPLEWLWADHQVDHQPPEFFGIWQPEYLVSAATNTLHGYVYDRSSVPTITLEIVAGAGGTGGTFSTVTCPDATPDDGDWSCEWDVMASNGGLPPTDGDVFSIRVQATDEFGQGSTGSANWQPFLVDTIPPTVSADAATTQALSGTLLTASSVRLGGQALDNHAIAGAEVCLEGVCGAADVQLEPVPSLMVEDAPETPITIDGSVACGSGAITRTFVVTEGFAIGTVSVGFDAQHTHRDQLRVELESPTGTRVRLLNDDFDTSTHWQNYDVWLSDAATSGLHDAGQDDESAPPYYDRAARPYRPLSVFAGEVATGTWTLTICDTDAASEDGYYHRSRLELEPQSTAPLSGTWSYEQDLDAAAGMDSVEQTVSIYGLDLVGNRTADPQTLTFWVDNVAPVITVTQAITQLKMRSDLVATPVLTGTVSDGGRARWMSAFVQTPEDDLRTEQVARDGDGWHYDLQPTVAGRYLVWVNAEDEAGNTTSVGPFEVEVPFDKFIYLPLVMRNS